jgi:DNA-binding beta-propeller fold protein YncE
VLGQADMDDNRLPTVPVRAGNIAVADSQNVAVVVDEATSRVLVYGNLGRYPTTPLAAIGQPDLVTTDCNSGGLDARSLCAPTAAVVDAQGNLWVADTGNNRVLQYAAPWLSYDYPNRVWVVATEATRVFGQPSFTQNECTRGATGLCRPQGVAVDFRQNLYIADSENHRIVHHENPLADAVAERVYGQATFADASCNAGGLDANALCDPRGLVMTDAGDLYVADRVNSRVVLYQDVFANGGGADRVWGQPSTASSGCAAGADGLCGPRGVTLDRAGNLVIADTENSRVLVFDAADGDGVADRVLGQPDFATTRCGSATSESLCTPIGVAANRAGDALLVADAGHERIVRYDAPYCLGTFLLGPGHPRAKGVSQPQGTKLKIATGKNPAVADDILSFADKLILLENDGTIDGFDTPLLTLSTSAGVVYREKVPSVSNTRLTSSGGTYETRWLKGERDVGIDDYKISTHFVIPGNDANPQYDKVGYKGRAVGLDLSGFTASQATFEDRFSRGSLCFSTERAC